MAMAIIIIVFAAVVPQFRVINNSWDSKRGNAEVLQNGRVLMDHISRNLSKAVSITAVSDSCETNGYIEFEDNDGNNLRYEIDASNYVGFGPVGSLSDLAGPVSSLRFTCYDDNDFDTSITDVNSIRFVNVQATLTNSASMAQDKTFSTSVYLRSNQSTECELVGWWKLDETSGTTAADSSDNSNDGTLVNMAGNEWTAGQIGGALAFDGTDDYVNLGTDSPLNFGNSEPFTIAAWVKTTENYGMIVSFRSSTDDGVVIDLSVGYEGVTNDPGKAMILVRQDGGGAYANVTGGAVSDGQWHHVAGVRGPGGTIELFLDGVSQGTDSGAQSGGAITTDLRAIGSERRWVNVGYGIADQRYLVGTIDDVRIYNRALDANEVAQLTNTISYDTFNEAKVSTADTSITISTPGDSSTVATLGSWTSGLTHTAEAGSNRALILIAHGEEALAAITLNSVTYGGQAMTKVIERIVGTNPRDYVVAYILNEAGVAAATSGTFVPTWSTTPDEVSYTSVFLSNVDQADPIGASASNGAGATSGATITTSALATSNGDMVIDAATCGNVGDYTVNNSFTEAIEQDMATSVGTTGYKTATGSDETPSVTHVGTLNRQVIIGFVVQGGDISSIEGDLLIAAVATDGDTSSSLAPPVGEGWTEIDVANYGGEVTLGAWWKLADASESASHQFTWTGDEQAYGWMMHFTGNDPTDPINVWSSSGESSSTPTSPAVTTTVDNCMIVRLGAFDDDNVTIDNPGLSSHTAITMDESDSATSGTISILGSWTTDLTHTAEAGTNRALIFIAHEESISGSPTLTSVTYGGQAMTKVIERSAIAAPYGNYVAAFILNEVGINAATSSTFVPTWSNATSSVSYSSVFLSGVDQTTSIGATASNSTTSALTNPITTSALSTANGDMVILGATCGNNGSYDISANGFTEGTDQSVGAMGHTGVTGHKAATGANETPSATHTAPGRQAIIGLVVQSGSGITGTVSGGAGYIMQSSSGDSGTSTFTLGSSNEAQMITIAIAPDVSEDLDACGNGIVP